MRFSNRAEAGRQLARQLRGHLPVDTVVLGLPRGGVPVAAEVARAFGLPLDVIVVRKVGLPFHPELAMGAIGEGDVTVVDRRVMDGNRITPEVFARVEHVERAELNHRATLLRQGHDRLDLEGRAALIVDDGIATGSTARAACAVARAHGARTVIVAAPVAPNDAESRITPEADEVHVVLSPKLFGAVGQFYDDFAAVPDDEVARLLADQDRT